MPPTKQKTFKPQSPRRPRPAGQDYPWPHHPDCSYLQSVGLEWCDCYDGEAADALEQAQTELASLRLKVQWDEEQGLPQIQPAHDILDALHVPECIHDEEHLCDTIAERIGWLAEAQGEEIQITTHYGKALQEIRDASDEVCAEDLRAHAEVALSAVKSGTLGDSPLPQQERTEP